MPDIHLEAFELVLALGIFFGFLGALMAFLITYNEYQHHYPDKATPCRKALGTAIFTFLFFAALSVLLGMALNHL